MTANLTTDSPVDEREARDETAVLSVRGLGKTYPAATAGGAGFAVRDVNFDVHPGELVTLLGPSGCGKTTTLRSVAGLEEPDAGSIRVAGSTLYDAATGENLKPNDRGIAMVFQSYAIWPHMTVAENVAFPLQVRRRRDRESSARIARRVDELLEVVGLGAMGPRPSTSLSGGQQQRLALARALVMEPALMLLDEPLSNLDAKLRESMRVELKRLQHELGVASVYVTHDQEEALALSNRIAVMNEGRIVQLASPREIYDEPADAFVAGFVGTSTMATATVMELADDFVRVDLGHTQLWARRPSGVAVGEHVTAMVRPEHVGVAVPGVGAAGIQEAEGPMNEWRAEVVTTAFLGASVDRFLRVGDWELRARTEPLTHLLPGDHVDVRIAASRIRLLRS